MEEKKLLKEITFLSKLIGQHKNKLRSHPSCTSKKTVYEIHDDQQHIQYSTNRIQVQNLKSTTSRYTKVNHTLPENIPKQIMPSSGLCTTETVHRVSQKKVPSLIGVSTLSRDKTILTNDEKSSARELKRKISDNLPSVHINPSFFITTNTEKEIASLRCKSVHINPRLLATIINKTNTDQGNSETSNSLQILPTCHSDNSSPDESLWGATSFQTSSKCVAQNQSVDVPSQGSTGKSINLSAPSRTSTARKKYVYRSKTKLVKATLNLPVAECKIKKPMTPVGLQNAAKTIKTPHGGVLLAVSRTKLVRLPGKSRRLSSSKSDLCASPSTITKSRYRFRRVTAGPVSSPILRTAKKVCLKYRNAAMVTMQAVGSKYHLDRRLIKTSRKGKPGSCNSRYKVDHRTTSPARTPTRVARVRGHLLISPLRRSSFSNRIWASAASPLTVQKVAISHKKLLRIGCNLASRNYLQNSALVRIGGLLYKSSRTKLILSKTPEKMSDTPMKSRTVVKRCSLNAGHIVYVRGNKFVMDETGKTLKRVPEECTAPKLSFTTRKKFRVSRVDIGGVTYVQKTPTMLVRTNTHTARNLVSNAKQRSIAFLAQKMRKINTPCLFYRRFGRCPRYEKGRCDLVHDPKYIDICKKFLQGKCTVDGCLLSHDVGPEKMPTCRFFLEGCCVRDLCPYLHVKVNDRAPICRNFLLGYCDDGPECLKRHILLCPEFDKNGSCAKGKYCPYPHSTVPRVQRAICSEPPITINNEQRGDQTNSPAHPKRKRYYETDSDEQNEDQVLSPTPHKMKRYYDADPVLEATQDTQSDLETSADDLVQSLTESPGNVMIRRRPKIGDLPSFIALESFEME